MKLNAFRYAMIVAFGGFVFGLDAAIISGTVKFITAEFQLSNLQVGTVVSAPGFGVIIALLVAGYLADKYGRKNTLLVIAAFYVLSAVCSTFAPSFTTLVAARFLGGLAFTSLTLAAMYIGEIAPSQIRGKLVAMNQINIVIGLSTAYFINYLILQASNSGAIWVESLGITEYTWRWMLGMEIIPAFVWFLLLFTVPKSPRWLMLRSRIGEAKHVLTKLIPAEEIDSEIIKIQESINQSTVKISIASQLNKLFSSKMRLAFSIGITIAIAQQITGINAILFYAPTVFEQVGIGTDAAFMQAIYVGLSSLVFTVIALFLIDKLGRRPLTLWGLLWIVVSLGICAYGFNNSTYELTASAQASLSEIIESSALDPMIGIEYDSDVAFKNALNEVLGESVAKANESVLIQTAGKMPSTLILFGILSFICAFHFSVGPIMWVLFSEIFPVSVRGVAIPFFALITSIVSYLVQQFFPILLATVGARDIFLFYAVFSAIGLIILFKILPETKNKTIEEIETTLGGGNPEEGEPKTLLNVT